MTYAIRSSHQADADVAEILDWIAERSPDGAVRWLAAFEAAIDRLRERADRCSRAPETDELSVDLRQLLFRTRRGRPYRIVFVIRDEVVHLAAVRGPGEDDITSADIEFPE